MCITSDWDYFDGDKINIDKRIFTRDFVFFLCVKAVIK